MRADIVHVTDHAILRWRERAAKHAGEGVEEIIKTVKASRVLSKKEPLPYSLPRYPNSVYSAVDDILFILESVTITEYRLITVITAGMITRTVLPPSRNKHSSKTKVSLRRRSEEKKRAEKNEQDVILEFRPNIRSPNPLFLGVI